MNLPRNLHYLSSVRHNASNGVINYACENKEPENHIPSPKIDTNSIFVIFIANNSITQYTKL